jgi:hypothetical protein
MQLSDQLKDYVAAAYAGVWIVSSEPDEVERELGHLAREQEWKLGIWDVARGVRFPLERNAQTNEMTGGDPLAPLRALSNLASRDGTALMVLHNYHRFLGNPEVVQTTFTQVVRGKQQRTFVVVVAPGADIPVELQKVFVVLDHPLPDRSQLARIAQELTSDHPEDLPDGPALERVLDGAAGLSRFEAEGAFALSLARHGVLRPECIWQLKAQALAKSGLCSLYRGDPKTFDTLQGVDHVRQLTAKLLRPNCPVPPKGWLFVGPPNCGKTSVAKAIAADNHLPLILADLPSLKSKFVGDSEGRVRRFIGLCEAMAPCCVLLDEVEDALAGATAEQSGDSGVSRDQLSTILKWRSESRSRVFLIATCNEPEKLLRVKQGALFRDGRFDGVVFFDIPDRKAKDAMWCQYRDTYRISAGEPNPPDEGWAPGNIEVCCQRSIQYGVSLTEAASYVRPTPVADIERLRDWADGRCLSASHPGIFRRDGAAAGRSSRRIRPSSN